MISPDYVAEMAAYNRWQNDVVFGLCDGLDDAARKADRGMFFGSIHHTLDHIAMVNEALLIYLDDGVPPAGGYGDIRWPDWEALKAKRLEQDAALEAAARDWTGAWMASEVVMNSPRLETKPRMPRWVLIAQIFNHQTHHRAQVTAELHRLGLNYGSTDMPFRPGAGYFNG
jgi:uncharacterized damage-inducible protein DinB